MTTVGRNESSPGRAPGDDQLSKSVGISLKPVHFDAILETRPDVGFFEAHPENYMQGGGPMVQGLRDAGDRYPLSLHAVGLSLGSPGPVDSVHLGRLKRLVEDVQPRLVSDHLSWSRTGGVCLPDLLPLPYTQEVLGVVSDNVSRVQDVLGRAILIENPSLYLCPKVSKDEIVAMNETDFLAALTWKTGCGILLDINNVYVSANNTGLDAMAYLAGIEKGSVGEIHLAGHKTESGPAGTILIDDHGGPVADDVWDLYRLALKRLGPVPTLVEWDTDVPSLGTLLAEADKAKALLQQVLLSGSHEHAA